MNQNQIVTVNAQATEQMEADMATFLKRGEKNKNHVSTIVEKAYLEGRLTLQEYSALTHVVSEQWETVKSWNRFYATIGRIEKTLRVALLFDSGIYEKAYSAVQDLATSRDRLHVRFNISYLKESLARSRRVSL